MKRSWIAIFLIGIVLILLIVTGRIDLSKPEIGLSDETLSLGENSSITVKALDNKPGIKNLNVYILQNNNKVKIFEQDYNNKKEVSVDIKINPRNLGLLEGDAKLEIIAVDGSIFERSSVLTKDIKIDFTPPVVEILSSTQNLINGGTGFVFTKSSEDLKSIFIKVENLKFKCLKINSAYVLSFLDRFSLFNANFA